MAMLSKTLFQQGRQCPRQLWLRIHRPDSYERPNVARTETGHEIGEMAKRYFGDYSEISPEEHGFDFESMAEETRRLMSSGAHTICEATFVSGDLVCMVDVLNRGPNGTWDVFECKSTTKAKPQHTVDVAFQCHVLRACGVRVNDVAIMHVNPGYVREGELDKRAFFAFDDVAFDVEQLLSRKGGKLSDIEESIREFRWLMKEGSDDPETAIGCHCSNPYECGFRKLCWDGIPMEDSVFSMGGMSMKAALGHYLEGRVLFEDFPPDSDAFKSLNLRQREQVLAHLSGRRDWSLVLEDRVGKWMERVRYPVHFLDFETFQPAIPLFDGSKPYEQVPSQYSVHTLAEKGGSLAHREFLAKEGTDPRRALAESLCRDIPAGECVLAYNMAFEKGVIRRLAAAFPDLAGHLMAIHDSMEDLMVPFRNGDWYMAAQGGSYSIKHVLPAMFPDDPELDYKRLDGIHNGAEAMDAFLTLAKKPEGDIPVIREQLLRYCELDTLAMVRIWQRMEEEVL